MAIFKCKICGGELNLMENSNICECEYCGTRQTVPSADNEKKMNLFNRANRLRLANEFDKAAGVFESIVSEFPEEAEAYWGLVLCKYGIEYVDDPATARKVPTCHRTSFDGIFEDDNFQMALEYADFVAHKIYREEAKEIDHLQKRILEVASKEAPFDVFICYKETGEDGQRTKDSVLAQEMYDALTAKGHKVFFSRITLEDKLGQEYEPYIFAALNSAKVMLSVGTQYEYFNAVWVKNEWARFLELMKKDKEKVLIPCYCDIDAYDMPVEFKNLQGQDMSKIGFMQDLVRGVEKILLCEQTVDEVSKISQTTLLTSASNVASLLERAGMFLEDEDWDSADEYCERVLDIEPKNSEAYLYTVCAEHRKKTPKDLSELEEKFEESNSFKKALRFANADMKMFLEQIVTEAIEYRIIEEQKRSEQKRKEREEKFRAEKEEQRRKEEEQRKRESFIKFFNSPEVKIVACGVYHTIGLKLDGKVEAAGDNRDRQCNVSGWTDIISVACGSRHTIGLKADGKVVAAGPNDYGQCNVSGWTDIISADCGFSHTVGLKADGRVVATGRNNYEQCNVSEWTDIISVVCGYYHTVGLRSDGKVVATGWNADGQCNISEWEDIVSLACRGSCTVGVRSDGKVVATGVNAAGQCNVYGWTDILAVACGGYRTVGVRSDGRVVATGNNDYGECNVSKWKLFNDENQIREMVKKRAVCIEKVSKQAEEQRRLAEEQRRLAAERRGQNVCQHCGGEFKGFFTIKCARCGKVKDY